MSNAIKKRLAAFALCFLAWQALFIWLCTLGGERDDYALVF